MKRRISWTNLAIVFLSITILSIPLAIGYIPIYQWFDLKPPTNPGIHWVYGFLYCLIWAIVIFVILFITSIVISIKRLFNFVFPSTSVASSKDERK